MTRSMERTLIRRLHGELSPAEAASLEARMDREPELAAAYARLERAWNGLALPPSPGIPPGFAGRVMSRVRELPRPGALGPLSWGAAPAWVRAAAAASLIVGAALGIGVGGRWAGHSGWAGAGSPAEGGAEIFAAGGTETEGAEGTESLSESYWGEVADATLDGASPAGGPPDEGGELAPGGDGAQEAPL